MTDEELSRLLGEDFSSRKKPDPAAEPAPLPQDTAEETVTDIPEVAAESAIPAETETPA